MGQPAEAEQRIVDAMKQLSFTLSEARVYVALLKQHPATGYELAASSGVPRSAIYNVLKRLVALGLINEVQKRPAKYVPLPPDGLFELLKSRFSRNLDSLKGSLEQLSTAATSAATWVVTGYDALLEQAETLIRTAETCVHVSIWAREAGALSAAFERAVARGVDVVLFSFNPLPAGLGEVFAYNIAPTELEAHWEHKILLIQDHTQLLVGHAEPHEHNRAVMTDEPAVVEMAVSNLVLDVTLFGERMHRDVSGAVTRITQEFAPVEDLLVDAAKKANGTG